MEPIAIVGMACRFPGASCLEEFWNLLREGRDGINLIPKSRWDCEHSFDSDPEKPGKINTRHGGFIEGVELFDNDFFRIPSDEAIQMDPQQRIMLELAYEAFADAGLSLAEMDGTDTGVFVGVMSNDYLRNQTADDYRLMDRHTGAGSGYCMIANRISYQFNLRGPSMAIDSACSSSLISTFNACQSLWTHQCSVALAGGVNLILSPTLSVFYTRNGLSAPDGKCRTLSNDASGMGRGEGAGMVLLKSLSDAQRDGDVIYALIRGGAVNHNGRGNGMSAPNRWAQQSLLRKAHEHAGVKPRDLDYVELHGTGTLIGDAIEATALGSVLAEDQTRERPCLVGSVKTNLGHLEGAAGIGGLIKLALCFSRGQLAPSLWYSGPNPHVAFETLPLKVHDHLQDWLGHGQPRLAGISSFGLGGANAHLVLQSAPDPCPSTDVSVNTEDLVLQLSARSKTALVEMSSRYRDWMEKLDDEQFVSLCQTTLVRSQGHEHRATFVARSRSEMMHYLSSFTFAKPSPSVFVGRYCESPKRKRVFIFPGTREYFHAIAGLAKIHPCIRETLAECDQAIQEVLLHPSGFRLAGLCEHTANPDARAIPFAHFGTQVALARLWQRSGFEPDAVAGIGIGQIASWVVAEAIDIVSAIARIAALNNIELAPSASSCLAQSRPFIIDCYSSLGKNIAPAMVQATLLQAADENPNALPDMPQWKAVDYFVQSLEGASIGSDSFIAVSDAQSFRLELARLSVVHNVQWKNLLPRPMLMRPLPYPWQRSRFWLESNQMPGVPAARTEGADAPNSSGDESLESSNVEPTSAGIICDVEDGPLTAPSRALSVLNREELFNLPESERRSVLASYLKQKVAEALRLSADEMEEPQTFTGLGIDSLTALKLKNQVETDLNMPVSLVKLMDGHSIGDLATDLLSEGLELDPSAFLNKSLQLNESRSAHEQEQAPSHELPDYLANIPPEEIDRMLRELLNGDSVQQLKTLALNQ
jgi:acyl transferase domain-containing protein